MTPPTSASSNWTTPSVPTTCITNESKGKIGAQAAAITRRLGLPAVHYLFRTRAKVSIMKKYIFSIIVACLSLTSSLLTLQAAAQDQSSGSGNTASYKSTVATSVDGPRYEVVVAPDDWRSCYKIDKETGDIWTIRVGKVTKIDKEPALNDETLPGQNNYQLIVADSSYLLLLNVNTGTMWEFIYMLYPRYDRFKELDMNL